MDEVTLDLVCKIAMQAAADQGDSYSFKSGFPVVRKFVENLDRKGKRLSQIVFVFKANSSYRHPHNLSISIEFIRAQAMSIEHVTIFCQMALLMSSTVSVLLLSV